MHAAVPRAVIFACFYVPKQYGTNMAQPYVKCYFQTSAALRKYSVDFRCQHYVLIKLQETFSLKVTEVYSRAARLD